MLELKLNPFPILITERLILRRTREDDAQEFLSIRNNDNVLKYLDREKTASVEEVLQLIKTIDADIDSGNAINWAITTKDSDLLIGNICFWKINHQHYRAEIGYTLHPSFWGKGIMKEAITKVIDYGFNQLGFHSIEANVNPKNIRSIKLLEGLQFVREGYFRENYYYNGKFLDSAIYSLVNSK
jgi:ribosomal-protein-alanine N-acetyltransferase